MKSAPPKHVEHPTANADPMNITLRVSSDRDSARLKSSNGRRQTPDASDLIATRSPINRMPMPAAMLSGRLHASMIPELSSRWPVSPASDPTAVKTMVNPAMKYNALRNTCARASLCVAVPCCMPSPVSANV